MTALEATAANAVTADQIVDVRSVGVSYTTSAGIEIEALRSITLSVNRGEFVCIIGPSGCGKSTLLQCIGGLIMPSHGVVAFNGRNVTAPDPRRAAYIFQDYALLPWRSVLDNAALGLKFAGVGKSERRDRAMSFLRMVGLESFSNSLPRELSGGMQQRVAVARALAMEPSALLMDEPFGALDEQSRRRLGVEMSRLFTESGQTVLLVTHSLDEAVFWADRVIVLSSRPGEIVKQIRVTAPRPRDLSFMLTDEFEEVRADLFRMFELGQNAQTGAKGAK